MFGVVPYLEAFCQRGHRHSEKRFYCIGRVGDEIITVRFTYRGNRIRIIEAGHWRKGKKIHEENN